jgi:hypothetical protein
MRERCLSANAHNYARYGGRGITICQRWSTYANFLEDMGRRPTPKHTLERNNNECGYSKDNCVWATRKQQGRNRASRKCSVETATKIKRLYASDRFTLLTLAKQFGITESHVHRITRGKHWA